MVVGVGDRDRKSRAKTHAVFRALDPNSVVAVSVHGDPFRCRRRVSPSGPREARWDDRHYQPGDKIALLRNAGAPADRERRTGACGDSAAPTKMSKTTPCKVASRAECGGVEWDKIECEMRCR